MKRRPEKELVILNKWQGVRGDSPTKTVSIIMPYCTTYIVVVFHKLFQEQALQLLGLEDVSWDQY